MLSLEPPLSLQPYLCLVAVVHERVEQHAQDFLLELVHVPQGAALDRLPDLAQIGRVTDRLFVAG